MSAVALEGGVHRIRVSYFQGPRDCLALVLAVAGPGHRWQVFNTKDFPPPSRLEDWRYPNPGPLTILPTTPEEASLSLKHLFQDLQQSSPNANPPRKSDTNSGCLSQPVRSCSR